MRDDVHPPPLDSLLEAIARAAERLDVEDYDQASALAEDALVGLTHGCGADWSDVVVGSLLKRLGEPERARPWRGRSGSPARWTS